MCRTFSKFSGLRRWAAAGLAGFFAAILLSVFAAPALAAPSAAEQFVGDNVQKGLGILTNKALTKEQRRTQFQDFLTGLTNIKTIADYTLGQYRRGAAPADLEAYEAAYKDYALAVYRVYFDKFSGQTVQVAGSYALSGNESVVKTLVHDPAKASQKPYHLNFRISNAGGKIFVTDISVEGVWLRQTQRDDFTSFLGQHGGDIKQVIAVLKNKTREEQVRAK